MASTLFEATIIVFSIIASTIGLTFTLFSGIICAIHISIDPDQEVLPQRMLMGSIIVFLLSLAVLIYAVISLHS